jgi:tRNA uridine 5-carboxymethylaminomethyl modification enzyme
MDTVTGLIIDNSAIDTLSRVAGVHTALGYEISAKTVILCSGTFMEGRIFIGEYDAREGRLGEEAALGLGNFLRSRGFPMGRFKTGTPARIAADTIDYNRMEKQEGETAESFSFDVDPDSPFVIPDTVSCWITSTTPETHRIIRDNIHRSPLYSGKITGIGPRYCPSIEDKVVRFPERDGHHVFVEPEGLYTNEMYLNGLSSSLPPDVQRAFIHSIPGMENSRIVRPAYAVEYDYLDPLDLFPTLESKRLEGFFAAGQTNGSSGYEEAAAQGIMAGINAAMKITGGAPLVLGRAEAYIGVLIDDLTTLGADEPYRMFTSRAEHRLVLRHDTADTRLTPKGRDAGLVDERRWERFMRKTETLETIRELLKRREGGEFMETENVNFPAEWVKRVSLDNKYAGYIEKERRSAARNAKMDAVKLDPDFDYDALKGLSSESREKLKTVRPLTVGQAARIPGVRQGDTALLMIITARRH